LKCLSLRQSYAELVAAGRKTIETRKWNTNFRGKFLIHSSKTIDNEIFTLLNIDCSRLTKGAIIGVACLYDVKKYTNKEDFLADKAEIWFFIEGCEEERTRGRHHVR